MKKLPHSVELSAAGRDREYGNPSAPLPIVTSCPQCKKPHVDEGEWATRVHHVHKCVDSVRVVPTVAHVLPGCGFEWQPALISTVGVEKLK